VETVGVASRSIAVASGATAARGPWLFSRGVDLTVFLGSAIVSLALLAVGAATGVLDEATPEWVWIACVLLVDVAHVYSTSFKVYLDPEELRRRPALYGLVPALGYMAALAVYSAGGPAVFWRLLAYLAVFHFVRQQYGWVALYRGRRGEHDRLGHWLDSATIYAATLYPLLYWHASLPRRFNWFLEGDFVAGVPAALATAAEPVYWTLIAVYAARSVAAWAAGHANPGKDVVVATTAVCWYVGIVAFDSDYAFTVTNVIIHGVPYLALVYFSGRRRAEAAPGSPVGWFFARGLVPFLATLWVLAYVEELVWDRSVWGDREWLFGAAWDTAPVEAFLVPLLALPQIVHYTLDGFIWKRRERDA
jgi:hypothetical protein